MQTFDVLILGGGPGGTSAARLLAKGGKKVALAEDTHWGGTCLNCGCIPTKLLLGAVAPGALLAAQQRLRVAKGEIAVDYTALQTRVARFTKGSSQALAKELTGLGVTLLEGRGVCAGTAEGLHRVRPEGKDGVTELAAAQVVLACGTSSAAFPGLTPDNDCVLDSTALLRIAAVPESLLIVGAGASGLEMGDFFRAMGSKVTIVEAAPHIAPLEDADVAKEMLRALTKAGVTCLEGARAKELRTVDGQARLTLEDGREITAAKALVAVGRTPNTRALAAESLGCTLNRRGYLAVDAHLEAAPGVYAVGDVNGLTLLAHAAEHQAGYVARRILGREFGAYASGPVPSCVYGSTEIMRVGPTAKELLREGRAVSVSQAPLTMNPIAQASGHTAGFVKVVWEGERPVGMAAVGGGVSHLVSVASLLLAGDYTPEKLHTVMIAHPTLDEILPLAMNAPRAVPQ